MDASRKLFASYAREDERIVRQLIKLIGVSGAFIFFDQDHIEPGSDWVAEIEAGIAQADGLIVFWSRNAVDSDWVRREWAFAVRLAKRVIPVRLDATEMPDDLNRLQAIDLRIGTAAHGLVPKTVLRSLLEPWDPDVLPGLLESSSKHLRDELASRSLSREGS